jgi:hypothetical protein
MSRRFQFSLRALLGMAVVVCLALGGWHLLVRYGQFVEMAPTAANEPRLRGQFIFFSLEQHLIYRANVMRGGVHIYRFRGLAESDLPFVYRFNGRFADDEPEQGEYAIEIYPMARPYPAASCTFALSGEP